MWEFEIYNNKTGERDTIFGYSYDDALRRSKSIVPEEWNCIMSTYVD